MTKRTCSICKVKKDLNTDNFHLKEKDPKYPSQRFHMTCKPCKIARDVRYQQERRRRQSRSELYDKGEGMPVVNNVRGIEKPFVFIDDKLPKGKK